MSAADRAGPTATTMNRQAWRSAGEHNRHAMAPTMTPPVDGARHDLTVTAVNRQTRRGAGEHNGYAMAATMTPPVDSARHDLTATAVRRSTGA
jgi:hypothetical protein